MILLTRPTDTQRGKNVVYKKLKVPVVMILEMFWLVHKQHHLNIFNLQMKWPCVVVC